MTTTSRSLLASTALAAFVGVACGRGQTTTGGAPAPQGSV
ncbi:MAG: hypothetical protein JWL71_4604, partial [Acidobacteria bacterium]|nr:hypothetical protein [Acidobacteriota bacterium]